MPISLKQLEQRYQNACDNIKDCEEYTIEHLTKDKLEIDVKSFYKNLHLSDLDGYEQMFTNITESVRQCRQAIRSEKSRRSLQKQIADMTSSKLNKAAQKHIFKVKRLETRLNNRASPYSKQPAGQTDEPQHPPQSQEVQQLGNTSQGH